MAIYRSPLTVALWSSSFLNKYGPRIPPAHKAHQTFCRTVLTIPMSSQALAMGGSRDPAVFPFDPQQHFASIFAWQWLDFD
ncbi:hypothetical protein TNCV_679811 [Trichonephila clavipes]|nr:hypothetical protein TNCV_679811 [Trichonephila clavipes]